MEFSVNENQCKVIIVTIAAEVKCFKQFYQC